MNGNYTETVTFGDVMPVAEFHTHCNAGFFRDYDGHGHPMKDGKMDPYKYIQPSCREEIPEDATHIVWYNK